MGPGVLIQQHAAEAVGIADKAVRDLGDEGRIREGRDWGIDNLQRIAHLAISSGDGEVSNALQIVDAPITTFTNTPFITEVTNSFVSDPHSFGGMLLNQHAGAHSPLLGTN